MFSRINRAIKVNAIPIGGLHEIPAAKPTVARIGPYRLFFYSADGVEPPHIHIERDASVAKYWLDPARLAHSRGYRASELRDIERLIIEHEARLLEAWRDYFD